MRYTHMLPDLPSPSDVGLIKAKTMPISLNVQKPQRLPTSQHHRIRKASISTGGSTFSSVDRPSPETKKLKATPEEEDNNNNNNNNPIVEIVSEAEPTKLQKPALPQLQAWESYLHWLCLTEEPGTLWSSSLCATFHECLAPNTSYPVKISECAARVDDIYWSFYLPLDPLLQFMEDRILSGYLLHVWTMFIELGKRIPYNDPAQDRLVELLKELVHLPPMEVRTWEGNDAPWSDLPTLDDALISAWDDLYDPEVQMSDPESYWVNYFAFLGRLVSANVTPDWWEIPAITLKEILVEDIKPTFLTRYKTMALAEFMNQSGDAFFEWCIDSGMLNVDLNMSIISPLMKNPIKQDWFETRQAEMEEEARRQDESRETSKSV